MKQLKNISRVVFAILFSIQFVQAQNYKAPTIDASGKVADSDGKLLGTITSQGVISDAAGITLAHVDATGSLVDEKTGKKLGKAEKNGNFIAHYSVKQDEAWTITAPMNGTCLVKDKTGKVIAEVHENYKAFGACAIHCLSNHMNHADVLDNSGMAAAYVCPMHADITSDKPGKCSKCGMELVKKGK